MSVSDMLKASLYEPRAVDQLDDLKHTLSMPAYVDALWTLRNHEQARVNELRCVRWQTLSRWATNGAVRRCELQGTEPMPFRRAGGA